MNGASANGVLPEILSAPYQTSASHGAPQQHGLGELATISAKLMPFLLRLAHITCKAEGMHSDEALEQSGVGLILWKAALNKGLILDMDTQKQLLSEPTYSHLSSTGNGLVWPPEPLRSVLILRLSQLGVARFARKYPAVMDTLLRTMLEVVCKYQRLISGIEETTEAREVDGSGQMYLTIAELQAQEAARRAVRHNLDVSETPTAQAEDADDSSDDEADGSGSSATWSSERRAAEKLVGELVDMWRGPIDTLSKAGRALEGIEALLGGASGGSFDLQGTLWKRKGWKEMDKMRSRLEDLKELRDLVRSLGRGGGWGPLRRAPIQYLDMKGRPGLLRTVLEQQETRGLTRADDLSRLLPSEAALLARGRTVRQAKLQFYAKMAEKGLSCYERDGWGEYPTNIIPERREVRPTADRGPILLCIDTSGSMRGARETVAKALALECMRAAKAQERGCFVFAFAGPQEVRELELGTDMASLNNLLGFLEKVFNGGSDFNEPITRCLERMTDAKWANSDILLVSDGELRQPGQEIMRKLAGAKDKLGLRVHGLIVGSPDKKRADPAVLKALCASYLPNGKSQTLVTEFEGWASVDADPTMKFDWDDLAGDARRREAGLKLESQRLAEMKRLKKDNRSTGGKKEAVKGTAEMAEAMRASRQKK